MTDELHRAVQEAVHNERTRLMSALINLRNQLDGRAKAIEGDDWTPKRAMEEAAGEVAVFINKQFGNGIIADLRERLHGGGK